MKILHVSPSYYPATQFGGPIQSVHLLNRELAKQGIQVDVFTTNAGLEQSHQSNGWQLVDGLKVRYFKYYGYVHYNFSPQLYQALVTSVQTYDLIHITAVWNFPVWAASFACRKAGVPYIISPRGTIYPETIALKSAKTKMWYYRLIAEKCLQKAAAIHYTAEDERKKVMSFLGLSVPGFVIPNGIPTQAYHRLSTIPAFVSYFPTISDTPYILFLGRLTPKKGLTLLVTAFHKLVKHTPAVSLVIAGPDEEGYKATIEKLIDKLGIANKVIFTGMLNGDQKLAAYRDAKVFVLSSYSENFGMSVVEAMACGTPVVISNQVGIALDIHNADAGIVTTMDSSEVAEAILVLLTDPVLCCRLTENGKKMIKEYYDIDSVAASFIKVYKQFSYVSV